MYMGSIAPSCVVPIPKNRTSHKVLRRLKVLPMQSNIHDKLRQCYPQCLKTMSSNSSQ